MTSLATAISEVSDWDQVEKTSMFALVWSYRLSSFCEGRQRQAMLALLGNNL